MRKRIHDESALVLPPGIAAHGVDFPRDLDKLHALELPVEKIDIVLLEWHLDLPFFWQVDQPFSLCPREVINHPRLYEYRMQRILGVDTQYPIDIIFWKDRWVILDGLHRYCKQFLEGNHTIIVRKLPLERIKEIIPEET